MKVKIKKIYKHEFGRVNIDSQHRRDEHAIEGFSILADSYEGKQFLLDKNDVFSFYGKKKYTDSLETKLNNDLRNKTVEIEDVNGETILKGSVRDYINPATFCGANPDPLPEANVAVNID